MQLAIDDLKPGQVCWLAYIYEDGFHTEEIRIADIGERTIGFRFADESGILPPERMSRAKFGRDEEYRLFDTKPAFRALDKAFAGVAE